MYIYTESNAVRYTGRWEITEKNAITTAPGGMIELAFKGDYAVLFFDVSMNMNPVPHLWISVDNGAKIEVSVDRAIRIEAEGDKEHYVKIIYKSGVEIQHRWYHPLIGKINFIGAEADGEGTLPEDSRRIIEFIGDSITEGVLIDEFRKFNEFEQFNRPYQDDSTATYAYLTATALGMKPVIMGYGAVGVTKGGCGSVPKASVSYPYNFEGSEAKAQSSDIIVINHGANDRGASPDTYIAEYKNLLDVVRKKNPQSKIVVLSAFCIVYVDELKAMIEKYNKENNDSIYFVDSSGWIPLEPLHPLRDGHITVAKHLTEELKKIL